MNYYTYIHMYNQSISHFIIFFRSICLEIYGFIPKIKEIRWLAIGTAAHGMGTARAMEMGPVEGAMSSLSICVAGIMTVAGASLFSCFW